MRRTLLRLISNAFVAHLRKRLPPSGVPATYHWQAECDLILDGLENAAIPDIGEMRGLAEPTTLTALEWLFSQVAAAHSGNWAIATACHLARLEARREVAAVLALIENPKTLGPDEGEGKPS